MKNAAEVSNKDIGITLHKFHCLLSRLGEQALKSDADLTFSEFRILMAIKKGKDISQKKIAMYHGLTEAAISRKIEDLIQRALITRQANVLNRREYMLALTPKGEKQIGVAQGVLERMMNSVFGVLDESEQRTFSRILGRLLESVKKIIS
ncbi:MAG: MarR family winged helix-turn-helix transcriptional regulator [Patescibacteria group bacterium]|jgi:DNA-binding MarR family transcriptional regulator